MEKRTVLAVVLSMLVLIGSFVIQAMLSPPPAPPQQTPSVISPQESITSQPDSQIPAMDLITPEEQGFGTVQAVDDTILLPNVVIETDVLRVELTNAGGNIVSYQLLGHLDDGKPVEMILGGDAATEAFAVAFGSRGDILNGSIRPVNNLFRITDYDENSFVEFSQNFTTVIGTQFTFRKRYEFRPGEYMFQLDIILDGGNSHRFIDEAYTLIFAPQIGPMFERLDGRYEFRNYLTYNWDANRGKMKTERVNENRPLVISPWPSWAAIAGKYFTLVASNYPRQSEIAFATHGESGIPAASRLYITRTAENSSRLLEDRYHFYIGPKSQEILNIYERGNNSFAFRDTGLAEIADTRGFLAPLEKVLKWFLMLFYGVIPNYGVAIILLTILVKLLMFPLTRKSSESTLRMQSLSPKMKELQEKYKDNKMKLNQEMAELYKKEGYNPLSGCLPMLLQMPIFFAMFSLFNNHFDLRGAMFIPGWITDLSRPESVFDFPDNPLPFLGWTALRLLPFIYVGSQLLYGKVTQNPSQGGAGQMKIMLYAMPIIFFFVLYNMPSGLLVYWIMSNVLTMVQQIIINKYILAKKTAAAAQEPPPVIAPGRPKKKKKK